MSPLAGIFGLLFLDWVNSAVGTTKLTPEEYEAFLKECKEPLPAQLSNSSAALSLTESEEGGLQLVCVDQSTQEVSKYYVIRDSTSGVLTVELEGSTFVLIVENSTKEIREVKRAVKKADRDQTTYFTADEAGKLHRVFQDESGQIQFKSLDMDSTFGPPMFGPPKLPAEEYEAFLKECMEPLPALLSNTSAALSLTESEEGGLQLVCVDQSTQQGSKYNVVRDIKTGVLTVELEGSTFVLIVENSTKEIKEVKRAVKKMHEDLTIYFTADKAGKLHSVFQDETGEIRFLPIEIPANSTFGPPMFGPPVLPPDEYEAFLKECMEPLPAQLSNSSTALSLTESEEGGLQLVCVDQSTQQESKYDVVRDSKTGVLTVELEGSVFLLIVENSAKEVKEVKRAARKTHGDQTMYFTADEAGKLTTVFQDESGQIKFFPIDLNSKFGPPMPGPPKLSETEHEALLKECTEPLPSQFSNSTAEFSLTENKEEGYQLVCKDQSTQQEHTYKVVRDSKSGVLTFESEGKFFMLIIEVSTKQVKEIKRVVKKAHGEHATFFTADDAGKLCSVFQDKSGRIHFKPIELLKNVGHLLGKLFHKGNKTGEAESSKKTNNSNLSSLSLPQDSDSSEDSE